MLVIALTRGTLLRCKYVAKDSLPVGQLFLWSASLGRLAESSFRNEVVLVRMSSFTYAAGDPRCSGAGDNQPSDDTRNRLW